MRLAARNYTEEALKTLAEIMRNTRASSSARVRAAGEILDRGWGRPTQELLVEGALAAIELPRRGLNAMTHAEQRDYGKRLAFLLHLAAGDARADR